MAAQQRGRGRGRGAAAWEELAARMDADERARAARGAGRGRGAVLVPAPAVVAADAGARGAGRGAGGGGAIGAAADAGVAGVGHGGGGGWAIGAAGHGRAAPVAAAAGNVAGRGGGRGAAAPAGNPLGLWLVGNTNHGDNIEKLPFLNGIGIDPKELEVHTADDYLTGDAETDDLYKLLASYYNTYGDMRVLIYEKAYDGILSWKDQLNYRKEKAHLMGQIGEAQQALRDHNAKKYPIPKALNNDPPFIGTM